MKNTFGNSLSVTLFGESHGAAVGAVIDGLAPGIEIDGEYIRKKLLKRAPHGRISTSRHENNEYKIISGVFEGRTTGTPLTLIMENNDVRSSDYAAFRSLARPGHADYTAYCKYHGYEDYRGGGHFSGRITAPLVGAGAVVLYALEKKGIFIGTHIKSCAGITDRDFSAPQADIICLNDRIFPVLDENAGEKMKRKISLAAENHDSIGGILETVIYGLPAGIGEPWFDSLESVISHGIFGIPAVKGIEFGAGFGFSDMTGSTANDPFVYDNGKISAKTNNNGGINGGISNGMPVIFRTVVKPTPSIAIKQDTVDFIKGENAALELSGRHDPCIVHRAAAVHEAVTAFAAADMLCLRFGTDYLA
ncbi:MAG: chorismate synthase [Clostridia bacterium]|nr:chorismate synthase [Clostridia bacterium]